MPHIKLNKGLRRIEVADLQTPPGPPPHCLSDEDVEVLVLPWFLAGGGIQFCCGIREAESPGVVSGRHRDGPSGPMR